MPGSVIRTHYDDARVRAAFTGSFSLAVKVTAAEVRSRANWRHVASSVYPISTSIGLNGAGGIGVGASDWARLEFGTRPHGEQPVDRKAMKFPDGGFARGKVGHPGTRAEPFLRPVVATFPEKYRDIVRARMVL